MREILQSRLSPGETAIVSFDSVLKVSQSFSDEFLGALISDLGTPTEFRSKARWFLPLDVRVALVSARKQQL
jgi:hypothetical protein